MRWDLLFDDLAERFDSLDDRPDANALSEYPALSRSDKPEPLTSTLCLAAAGRTPVRLTLASGDTEDIVLRTVGTNWFSTTPARPTAEARVIPMWGVDSLVTNIQHHGPPAPIRPVSFSRFLSLWSARRQPLVVLTRHQELRGHLLNVGEESLQMSVTGTHPQATVSLHAIVAISSATTERWT